MKNIITIVLITLLSSAGYSQTYLTQVKVGKTWGYLNEKDVIVIPSKYKKCFPFSEGYAAVLDGKKYGFIKPDGSALTTEIDGFTLNKKSKFSNGLVPILINKKWGYMNTQGKMVILPKYTSVTPFDNGYAIVKKESKNIIIDKEGNETEINIPDLKGVKPFSEGLAPVITLNNTAGFIDHTGALVINTQFTRVGYFKNGYSWAKNGSGQLGYINTKGEWIDEPRFAAGKDFGEKSGLARVKYNEKWAYVNTDGVIVYVNNTSVWGDFHNGLAKGRVGDLLGFYDNTGTYTIKPQFEAVRDFKNGFAAVKSNGKWGIINVQGEWVINPKYLGIKDMELIP